jgi:hypothetical protein
VYPRYANGISHPIVMGQPLVMVSLECDNLDVSVHGGGIGQVCCLLAVGVRFWHLTHTIVLFLVFESVSFF